MRNDSDLGPSAVANYVRGELARSLRSRKPYTVNLLLGGLNPITKKPSLYWLDYLAALAPLPYAAHGYAQYVLMISSPDIYFPPSDIYKRREAKMIACTLGTTACPYLISIIILISTLSNAWRFFDCAQMSWSGGYRSISKGWALQYHRMQSSLWHHAK